MANGRLLGICGSLRTGSFNRKLMREAARVYGPESFVEADLRLPLYDGDLEDAEGIPVAAQLLADQIGEAEAVIMVGPEYNKAMSGVLKNALDWVSRVKGNPWGGKPLAILSATAGRAGGERTQMTMRHAMMAFRPRLLYGPEVMIAAASKAFDEDGHLTDERSVKMLAELMQALKDEVALIAR